MKHLGIAFGVSFSLALLLFGIAYPIVSDVHVAEGLAAVPLVGCHHIAEMLERIEGKRSLARGRQTMIFSFAGFAMSWPLLTIYGMLVVVAIAQLSGLLAGLIVGFVLATLPDGETILAKQIPIMFGFIGLPVRIVGAYLLGRWVGARSKRYGFATILLISLLGGVLGATMDYYLAPSKEFSLLMGKEKSVENLIVPVIGTFLTFSIFGLLGYWRGRKRRFSKYMQYLLGVLPPDTRNLLMDLAFEEAERIGAAQKQGPQALSPVASVERPKFA